MISEGSYAAEQWSNDAGNSALPSQKCYILNCNNISQYCCFYCILDQINSALTRIRESKIITLFHTSSPPKLLHRNGYLDWCSHVFDAEDSRWICNSGDGIPCQGFGNLHNCLPAHSECRWGRRPWGERSAPAPLLWQSCWFELMCLNV